jgi:hypothetical protein
MGPAHVLSGLPMIRRILPLLLALLGSAALPAQTSWVVQGTGTPGGSGSAVDPFGSIQQAVQAATSGDAIYVLPGTYFEALDFLGKAVLVQSTNGALVTTIQASLGGRAVRFLTGEGPGAVLDGFTVQASGGGVVVGAGASPRIRNCRIRNHAGVELGAGILVNGGTPEFRDTSIAQNQAYGTAGTGPAPSGRGAGAAVLAGAALFRRCEFLGNTAQPAGLYLPVGGGLHVAPGASAHLVDCRLSGNTAYLGGAVHSAGSLRIWTSTLTSNVAAGGAAVASAGSLVLAGSVVAANQNLAGPALVLSAGAAQITGCTFAAEQPLGAIQVDAGASLACDHAIIWDCGPAIQGGSTQVVVAQSLVQGGWPGPGILDQDPLFVSPASLDFHLQPASPARDAGSLGPPLGLLVDLDGEPRLVGTAQDLGADEFLDPGAAQGVAFGTGCGTGGASPQLFASQLPALGASGFQLLLSQAPAGGQAYVFLAARPAPEPLLLAGACPVLLDLESLEAFAILGLGPYGPLAIGAAGTATLPAPIPNQPFLAGLRLAAQAGILPLAGPLLVTNGLYLVLN